MAIRRLQASMAIFRLFLANLGIILEKMASKLQYKKKVCFFYFYPLFFKTCTQSIASGDAVNWTIAKGEGKAFSSTNWTIPIIKFGGNKVLAGDVVTTSPASTLLPPNLTIGIVQFVDENALPSPFAIVQLTASPEAIDWVQVLKSND